VAQDWNDPAEDTPSLLKKSICGSGSDGEPRPIKCSHKWANPDWCCPSSAEPNRYHKSTATSGSEWSSLTTTRSPFGSVKLVAGIGGAWATTVGPANHHAKR